MVRGRLAAGGSVDDYIVAQKPQFQPILRELRALVGKAAPHVQESIKWGQPTYHVGATNLIWLQTYRDHVNIGFFAGATLPDPAGRLEGTGKELRHVKVYAAADIDAGAIGALIRACLPP